MDRGRDQRTAAGGQDRRGESERRTRDDARGVERRQALITLRGEPLARSTASKAMPRRGKTFSIVSESRRQARCIDRRRAQSSTLCCGRCLAAALVVEGCSGGAGRRAPRGAGGGGPGSKVVCVLSGGKRRPGEAPPQASLGASARQPDNPQLDRVVEGATHSTDRARAWRIVLCPTPLRWRAPRAPRQRQPAGDGEARVERARPRGRVPGPAGLFLEPPLRVPVRDPSGGRRRGTSPRLSEVRVQ